MKKSILLSLMVIGAVAAMITAATSAVFTDSATSSNNTFSTGTLDIKINSADSLTTGVLTFSNMAPGDFVVAPVNVSNAGSLDLGYVLSTAATDSGTAGLAAALTWAIRVDVTCNSSTDFTTGIAYSGTGLSTLGFGSSASSPYTGRRALVATSGAEQLCIKVMFPLTATSPQGGSTTATLTFNAEQTKNNP